MAALLGGLILLAIFLFLLWVSLLPLYKRVGKRVNDKINQYKNQEDENE